MTVLKRNLYNDSQVMTRFFYVFYISVKHEKKIEIISLSQEQEMSKYRWCFKVIQDNIFRP